MNVNEGLPGDAKAVTPSDTASNQFSGLYIGSGGDVAVITEKGTTVTFVGVPTGTIIPIRTSKVMVTNTSASSIVGFRP